MVKAGNSVKQQPTLIKIGDKWVNVNVWKRVHPGGAAPIDRYHGQDATDAFEALHSKEAVAQVAAMKAVEPPREIEQGCVPPTKLTLAFRKWRAQLEAEGMFERRWAVEGFYIGVMLSLCVSGYALAWRAPLLAMFLLGFGMQQAGWAGHDYSHARGNTCWWLSRTLSGLINGFSPTWWSDKHNTHHVHPNQRGIDTDIDNDPVLHLFVPATEADDVWFRRYQHLYYHFAYAFLYVSWRLQSAQCAWRRRDWAELAPIAVNYALLALLPVPVAIGSVLVGGWMVAEIVTATHQSEEFLDDIDHEFIKNQFITTRDMHTDSVFWNYVWGGMQFQLIHHLFPTMPRYNYPLMVPKLREFSKRNDVEYRVSGMMEIWRLNYATMNKFAQPRCDAKKTQ
eukprot:TRINITY_DN12_c0_g1_i2.p1 TRINITY_DN12_c0_g1~~TRINITY_DN12_c0_g1_i2.p1  ORF type:complete len:395 (+),score=197.37 TRINITY_DN12_c0_g1_i2:71-1255(+)